MQAAWCISAFVSVLVHPTCGPQGLEPSSHLNPHPTWTLIPPVVRKDLNQRSRCWRTCRHM